MMDSRQRELGLNPDCCLPAHPTAQTRGLRFSDQSQDDTSKGSPFPQAYFLNIFCDLCSLQGLSQPTHFLPPNPEERGSGFTRVQILQYSAIRSGNLIPVP